ncbi:Hermansky-Pudlak syndrome 6 protein [Scyliorhinus canicula]|uniref:Hermansky-Pudlak syndrome 6 protein n=1 Tax=Scyliorhinus canicula TaxID=7830 RepID=UPI0018F43810|nr:Hermansky-Pudlak syndrome 6 protein [Scyliorhinus canicula]
MPPPGRAGLRRLPDLPLSGPQLRDFLRPEPGSRLRCSSRRLLLYRPGENRLRSLERGQAAAGRPLDRSWPRAERLLEVLEPESGPEALAALLSQRGRAEFWSCRPAAGWRLLQAAELSSHPRARLLSAAWGRHSIAWCEERPRARPAGPQRCICSLSLGPGPDHSGLSLGPVRVLLHDSPAYRLLAAGEAVYLLPSNGEGPGNGPSNCPVPGNPPSNCPVPGNPPSNCPVPGDPPSNCLVPGNPPSNCPVPGNPPNNCPMPSKNPSNCPMPSKNPSNCPMPSKNPSNCPMPSNNPSNCPMPSNNPSNCPMPSKNPSNCPMPSNNPSNCPMPGNSPMPSNSPMASNSSSNCSVPLDISRSPMSNVAKFILIWDPREDTVIITSLAQGSLGIKRLLPTGSDFRGLVADTAGLLTSLPPLNIRAVTPCATGLLLATDDGEVNLMGSDGSVRLLCQLNRNLPPEDSVMMELCGTTLACTVGRTLHMFDTETGRIMEEMTLEVQPLALLSCRETGEIQLLAEDGVYALGIPPSQSNTTSGWGKNQCQETLELLVLEEACTYYQKRSLSRSRLTVEKLKSEAMFQAPLALCSILENQLQVRKTGHCNPQCYSKLHNIMAGEIQSYINLEEAKSFIINGSQNEVATYIEEITDQEIQRLLHCQLDRETLLYLNSIFNTFPRPAWKAVKRTLHLHQDSEGFLSARATADLWKVVLSPALPADQYDATNRAVPVFELICRLLYRFNPKWLPKFVELTQQHLATSRNYGGNEGPENAPLYKRALSVIPPACEGGTGDPTETAIELLLCSKRPNAIIQAVRILIERKMWQRAVEATCRFSQQGPLLKKELFTTMLVQLSHHRALDPYLEEIWELCPEEATAADILDTILGSVPSNCESGPYSNDSHQLTIGLLRPLLAKVLTQGACQPSVDVAEGLKTLVFPPPTPPRQKKAANQSSLLNSEPSFEANKLL